MSDELLLARDDDVVTITVNRPEHGNRFTDEMAAELTSMIEEANADARTIVLRAEGEDFCVGRQPPKSGRMIGNSEALDARDYFDVVFNAYGAFRRSNIPVVGVVQGGAFGFGCALAALCDMTIAGENATFQVPEMGHNILPTMVMSALIDRVPRKAVMHLTYSTEVIDAQTALTFGIVSRVVPNDALDDELAELVGALRKAPMPAVKAVKEFARSAIGLNTQAAIDYARNLHATVNSSSRMRK